MLAVAGQPAEALERVLREVSSFAVRLWTSSKTLQLRNPQRQVEVCSMINYCLREDDAEMMPAVVVLVRAINELCVTRRIPGSVQWPADFIMYRGGQLPNEHREFFSSGKKYRCPAFLATSSNRDTAIRFMQRQPLPHVLWRVSVHPIFHCVHANYIDGVLEGADESNIDALTGESGGEADPLYDQAVAIVLENKRPSISLVQRHLRIGYNRAARLLEDMEKAGLVSKMGNGGNREILHRPSE